MTLTQVIYDFELFVAKFYFLRRDIKFVKNNVHFGSFCTGSLT